jgi:hypothetical protein
MAKLGVGIGEEFPMGDSGAPDQETLRRQREWERRKQAFRDFWSKVKAAARESFSEDWDQFTARLRTVRWWPYGVPMLVLAAIFAISLASALLAAAPALLITGALFAFIFWRYRKRYGGAGNQPEPDVIITPPPQGRSQ